MHEAIDQRGGQGCPGGGIDAPGGDKAVFLRPEEALLPFGTLLFILGGGQRAGDAQTHVVDVEFGAFGIFFDQYLDRNFLFGKLGIFRFFGDGGKGKLLRHGLHGSDTSIWFLGIVKCVGDALLSRERTQSYYI